MKATAQILPVGTPTLNGRVYPLAVVQDALKRLQEHPLAIVHIDTYQKRDGAPLVSDSLGVASNLRLAPDSSHVLADTWITQLPADTTDYVISSAGFGFVNEASVVTEFTFTSVVIDSPKT